MTIKEYRKKKILMVFYVNSSVKKRDISFLPYTVDEIPLESAIELAAGDLTCRFDWYFRRT